MNIVCAVIQDNQIVVRSGEKSFLRLNGIYRISCIETKLAYYGSTAQSRGFRGRFWDHVYGLRKGTHSSRLMYRDWKRHGESSFVFEILEICEKEKCVEREQFYLDMYGVGINNQSYNTSPSANSCLGVRHSAEVVARQRERMKSPEGVLIVKKMIEANRGKPLPLERRQKISASHKGKKACENQLRGLAQGPHSRSRWYLVTDPNGQNEMIFGLKDFCRKHGLNDATMCLVAQGKYKQHKGWICRYLS